MPFLSLMFHLALGEPEICVPLAIGNFSSWARSWSMRDAAAAKSPLAMPSRTGNRL